MHGAGHAPVLAGQAEGVGGQFGDEFHGARVVFDDALAVGVLAQTRRVWTNLLIVRHSNTAAIGHRRSAKSTCRLPIIKDISRLLSKTLSNRRQIHVVVLRATKVLLLILLVLLIIRSADSKPHNVQFLRQFVTGLLTGATRHNVRVHRLALCGHTRPRVDHLRAHHRSRLPLTDGLASAL